MSVDEVCLKLHPIPVPAKVWHQDLKIVIVTAASIYIYSHKCVGFIYLNAGGIDMTDIGERYIVALQQVARSSPLF